MAGVAAEMLVGEEENFFALLKGPIQSRGGVGAGASRAAVLPGKGLDGGGGVHVSDRNDLARIEQRREFVPTSFHLADVGHIRHGTTGVQVGKNDGLVLAAEYVRAFGHEVHATEDDIAALGLRSLEGELEGVTTEIGELDNSFNL